MAGKPARRKQLAEFNATVKATREAVQRGEGWIVLPYAWYLRMKQDRERLRTIRQLTK